VTPPEFMYMAARAGRGETIRHLWNVKECSGGWDVVISPSHGENTGSVP